MARIDDRLIGILIEPERAAGLDEHEWDPLVRVARRAGLLARLAIGLSDRGVSVPGRARHHLDSEVRIAEAHHGNVRWEVRRIVEALGTADIPFIVLKGAAYVMAGLPPGRGRIFEDVDILVRREQLAGAESALGVHGWVTTHRHPYDQRYYRVWMHELPPLRHVKRGSSLDVHHTLLPLTAKLHPDPDLLWEAARPLAGWQGACILSPADMVLHSAAHLFYDGAFENGLRDLFDLDDLLRHFGRESAFWSHLRARACAMDLDLPLADALRWTSGLLGTPVPDSINVLPQRRRMFWTRGALDAAFAEGLRPEHSLCSDNRNRLARSVLYMRSHLLRMPFWRAAPHLLRKAVRPLEPNRT